MIYCDIKLSVLFIIFVKGLNFQVVNVNQEKCGFVDETNSTFLCQSEYLTGI